VSIQPRFEIPVLSPDGRRVVLRRSGLPAPVHLAGALARYSFLSLPQRARAARAALALARLDPRVAFERERAEGLSFGHWLREHGQDEQALGMLWDLIALPALNVPALEGSLALGAFTMRTGLLGHTDAGDIGFHERPFAEILDAPARGALDRAGVKVLLGTRAERVTGTAGSFSVQADGRDLPARSVICAIPHARAASLLEGLLGEAQSALWASLGESPIVNVHVVYDRPVCDLPFAAGVGTPVQYVFDRTRAVGLEAGQCLAVSISGAEREMSLDAQSLRERYVGALGELFPRARAAQVQAVHISREHAATFRATPGVDAKRPSTHTDVPGLLLAGAWTATGWPATLEGAVLSGHAAAEGALVMSR
jgi:squalene-associated FAD-dependent desaturase